MEEMIKATLFDVIVNNEELKEHYPELIKAFQTVYDDMYFEFCLKPTLLQ